MVRERLSEWMRKWEKIAEFSDWQKKKKTRWTTVKCIKYEEKKKITENSLNDSQDCAENRKKNPTKDEKF